MMLMYVLTLKDDICCSYSNSIASRNDVLAASDKSIRINRETWKLLEWPDIDKILAVSTARIHNVFFVNSKV